MPAPTGIDRVERAYIRWALGRDARFLAGFDGRQHVVCADTVRRLIAWLDGAGDGPGLDIAARLKPQRDRRLRQAQSLIRRDGVEAAPSGGCYLNVGHDNLSAG